MLSPAMRSAVAAGDNMGNKLKSQFTGIEYSGRKMNHSIDEVRDSLQQLERIRTGTKIKQEFEDATREVRRMKGAIGDLEGSVGGGGSSGGGFGLGTLIKGNLISSAITKAAGLAKDVFAAAISEGAKQEANVTGLKTFLGDAGAKAAYDNIKRDAAATPFDTESLLASNRALISAGASADAARKDTMNLANAISAVGGGSAELARMAANMQQVKTTGQATAMDIKQFAMAGINIYQLLADETGKSIAQVQKMDVTYDLLSRSLARAAQEGGAYYGAMEAQGKTFQGKWSTFMDNIKMSAAGIFEKLQPVITKVLDMAMSVTGHFSNWIEQLNPVWEVLNEIPAYVRSIVDGSSEWSGYFNTIRSLVTAIWATVYSLLGNVWDILKGVIEWVKKSELLSDIFWALGKMGEFILYSIGKIGDALVWIWDNVIKPILDGIDWVYSKLKGLMGGGKAEIVVTDGTKRFDGKQVAPGASGAMVYQMPPGVQIANRNEAVRNGNMNLDSSAKERSDSINGGGQRSIVINIGKQIETMEVHVMNAQEGEAEIENMVREAMRRVVYSINGVAV